MGTYCLSALTTNLFYLESKRRLREEPEFLSPFGRNESAFLLHLPKQHQRNHEKQRLN
jgi:hypothetical protein